MDKNTAFEMYKMFRGEMYGHLNLHRETLQNYLAFSVAVLGATIGGYLQLGQAAWIGTIILFAGSILNIFVCVIAIRMCDRFYLGVLERVAIMAKIESILGLTNSRTKKSNQEKTMLLPKDKYLLPQRWVMGADLASTEEFIEKYQNAGVNHLAKTTFRVLIVLNVFLGVAGIAIAFLQYYSS